MEVRAVMEPGGAGGVTTGGRVDDLLREVAPRALGVLVRRYGRFDDVEQAVQEARLAAPARWSVAGVPADPVGWLAAEAGRALGPAPGPVAMPDQAAWPADEEQPDDLLRLLFLCCHPVLAAPTRLALTLRAVGGLTTAEIARALLLPEPTVASRIGRAKQRITAARLDVDLPGPGAWPDRLDVARRVLYQIFQEGYAATAGPWLHRGDLAALAIRLTRAVHRRLPDDRETTGLLALMLLTDARRAARATPDGTLIPLAGQDRRRWHRPSIQEGAALVGQALTGPPAGPFLLQAAIATVHDEAPRAEDTDWAQILTYAQQLVRLTADPVVALDHAVAVAMVHGPAAGLAELSTGDADGRLAGHPRLDAVRAHLLALAGERHAAREAYLRAASRTGSLPERSYLGHQAASLEQPPAGVDRPER
jgi:predicted RNA polymerase sigma factor